MERSRSQVGIVLVALALGACGGPPEELAPVFTGYAANGVTQQSMNADKAKCRNVARSVGGWYWDAYSDCMIGKGYEPGRR